MAVGWFYRLLSFTCDPHPYINVMPENRLYQELIATGADQEVLDRIITLT